VSGEKGKTVEKRVGVTGRVGAKNYSRSPPADWRNPTSGLGGLRKKKGKEGPDKDTQDKENRYVSKGEGGYKGN